MPQSAPATESLRQFSVRMPETLALQIDELAKEEVRSANYIVNMLAREAISARQKKPSKKAAAAA